jgi:hypothetical protein
MHPKEGREEGRGTPITPGDLGKVRGPVTRWLSRKGLPLEEDDYRCCPDVNRRIKVLEMSRCRSMSIVDFGQS